VNGGFTLGMAIGSELPLPGEVLRSERSATSLRVSEIFYSLQGEGRRAGEPSVFVRLSGCSAKYACYGKGIRCDTNFEGGRQMELAEIVTWCNQNAPNCDWIVWTGGEPADQLKAAHVQFFRDANLRQAIETSGLHPVPEGLDWISVSPKVAEHVVKKNFPNGVTELRYVMHNGMALPEPAVKAEYYFLSPHSDGYWINSENLRYCIELCQRNPQWALSVQQHKLWGVL
jgi:7-carboxy-7-deazaguanine synthase